MVDKFFTQFFHCFFIAFGVIIGGTLIGSIGSFLTGDAPLLAMNRISQSLKIWAIVAAIGGTFDAIDTFQKGILDGSTMDLMKQIAIVISTMAGVTVDLFLINWITYKME